jgi:hypothetical protein
MSVKDTRSAQKSEKQIVRAMSLNSTPAMPGTKRTGKNTEIVVRVEAMMAVDTSAVPRSALSRRFPPSRK